MSDHTPPAIERCCDVAVLGASEAGLAAALELVRLGRSVLVVDGSSPTGSGCEELRRHGGEILTGRVLVVDRGDDGTGCLGLGGGHALLARYVVDAGAGAASGEDVADGVRFVVASSAVDGSRAAAEVAAVLDEEDGARPGRRSGDEVEWDHRYAGDGPMWSGNPNGTLVAELAELAPGRVLDVGAGEGGDAIWLAERGWRVTASDISSTALALVAAEARRRGLEVECLHRDANAPGAFETGAYDLVSMQYGAIHRTPDDRGLQNLTASVAAGGTLLVVGHDLAPLGGPVDVATQARMFDPGAYLGVDAIATALAEVSGWEIECHEVRGRPPGAASAHHVEDVVLRARKHRR